MRIKLRHYKYAGKDMADLVASGSSDGIHAVFKQLVEMISLETTDTDRLRAREAFFSAYEHQTARLEGRVLGANDKPDSEG